MFGSLEPNRFQRMEITQNPHEYCMRDWEEV